MARRTERLTYSLTVRPAEGSGGGKPANIVLCMQLESGSEMQLYFLIDVSCHLLLIFDFRKLKKGEYLVSC